MIKTFQITVECRDEDCFKYFVHSLKLGEQQLISCLYEPMNGWGIISFGDPVEEDEE